MRTLKILASWDKNIFSDYVEVIANFVFADNFSAAVRYFDTKIVEVKRSHKIDMEFI